MSVNLPLGRPTAYPDAYAPELLCAVPRAEGRRTIGLGTALPFRGEDVWNAWELTWLDNLGRPRTATAVLRVPADSANLVESKSLKLYLGSLAMTRFDSPDEVAALIARDLERTVAAPVAVELAPPPAAAAGLVAALPGACIDEEAVACEAYEVDPSLLSSAPGTPVAETLHSHLLRSNCPVTGQPDFGSVLVRYRGPRIDRGALLRYIVSYRRHCAFHESCIERMFVDIATRCGTERLTVYGRDRKSVV